MGEKWPENGLFGPKMAIFEFQQSTLCGYSKVVSGDAWHHTNWFNKFLSLIFRKNGRKMAEKWPKMAYLGPKWPFLKFQQSTLCGYSKIVSRDAWHHAKWINKFDHQFLGKMAQKWHNRTQKWPFSKYQQSTLLGQTRPKMAIFKVTAKYLLWVLYTCVKRCLTILEYPQRVLCWNFKNGHFGPM